MWTGTKPDISLFKTFGCKAFVHIPDETRTKLEPKSVECIFLGLSETSKAYRFYDPKTHKLIKSRDAIFCEEEKNIEEPILETPINLEESDSDSDNKEDPPPPRRSTRIRKPPVRFADSGLLLEEIEEEPETYEEAIESKYKENWEEAMQREMEAIDENHTWTLEPLPKNRQAIGSKWVFKMKRDSQGNVERFKARIVAKGYAQVEGIDYFETFAPVAKISSIRTLLALANIKEWIVHQMDVVSAFLNGDLLEEVYMTQPKGFIKGKNLVCKLHKSLYGLKQASRAWYQKIDSFLLNKGLKRVESDHSIYTQIHSNEVLIITIYVDDLLLVGSNLCLINDFKTILSNEFKMKDLGEANFILGIKIERSANCLYLSQEEYLTRVLKRFNMTNCKSTRTPLELGTKSCLSKPSTHEKIDSQNYPYREAIGCLMYAMLCTRPDLGFPICF